ncbi:MAG: Hsp70 family protein [Ktedonobacteraceae bacterium]
MQGLLLALQQGINPRLVLSPFCRSFVALCVSRGSSVATERAARLAGFKTSPLLQEPVAAALAYAARHESERAYWLVYDLGGGTFDAAVIRLEGRVISVVNHSGDNNLGGKLIDWAIVEDLFIPALIRQAHLSDFRRGNPKWRSAVAKLKQDAESVKIRLSREESVLVTRDLLCLDDNKNPISFEIEVHRADVQRLAEPFIVRTINCCRKALGEKSLRPTDIQRVVLVGGPTLMPFLRERLENRESGLGIQLEYRIDPLTVVAQGAAMSASNQLLPQTESRLRASPHTDVFTVDFPAWNFRGADTNPFVAGIVTSPQGASVAGVTVQFVNEGVHPVWRSGQIELSPLLSFATELLAAHDGTSVFQLILRDSTGRQQRVETSPAVLKYTVGAIIDRMLLTHSIGVALAHNEVEWFLEKGAQLPVQERRTLRTAYEVTQGASGRVIRIPVIEGASPRADRNNRVGTLEIVASQLPRDLPVGSEVEVTIEADKSSLVRMTAYIPVLAKDFTEVLHFDAESEVPTIERLAEESQRQLDRLARITETHDPHVQAIIQQIYSEQMTQQVEVEIGAAQDDPGLIPAAQKRLSELASVLDKAEDSAEWPYLVTQAEQTITQAQAYSPPQTSEGDVDDWRRIAGEIQAAIRAHDGQMLRQRTRVLRNLTAMFMDRADILPRLEFSHYAEHRDKLANQAQAEKLLKEGREALAISDFAYLRRVNQHLKALWPPDAPPPDEGTLNRSRR